MLHPSGGQNPMDQLPPQQGLMQQPGPPQGQPTEGGGEVLERFVDEGLQIIYGGDNAEGEVNADIIQSVRGSDPVSAIASAGSSIGAQITQAMVKQQIPINQTDIAVGSLALVMEIAKVMETEGLYQFSEDELMSAALNAAEQIYQKNEGLGVFNKETAEMEMQKLIKSNESGELDQAMQAGGGEQEMAPGPPAGAPPAGAQPMPPMPQGQGLMGAVPNA